MEMISDKNLIVSTKTDVISSAVRPSSPRQFFERIYGNLDNNTSNAKSLITPEQSELSSSPDILTDR